MGKTLSWLLLVTLAVLLAACGESGEPGEQGEQEGAANPRPEVVLKAGQVEAAAARTVNPSFEITGITEPIQSARVNPQVTARVLANHFKGGEMVEVGTALVELDPADYQAAQAAAEAALQSAQANLKQAQANWDRAQSLQPEGYISQMDYDNAEAGVGTARAAVSQAEAALEKARLDLERTRVSAPFSGRIGPPRHAVGDLVSAQSGTPLFELVQLDPIYVIASVEQGTYNRFVLLRQRLRAEGRDVPELAVSIELTGGEPYPYPGTFQAWDDTADAAPGMIVGRTVFPNPDQILLPGQNVTLRGEAIESVEGVFVPQRAVMQDQQGHYVLALDSSDTVVRRNIEVGLRLGPDWSVRSGLQAGERLIVQGAQRLAPGTRVRIGDAQ